MLQGDTLVPYLSAIEGDEDFGFTIKSGRSRRVGSLNITDLDFADDIALSMTSIRFNFSTARNTGKCRQSCSAGWIAYECRENTIFMTFNQTYKVQTKTQDGSYLEVMKNFKYLSSWVQSTDIENKTRKALAWKAKAQQHLGLKFCQRTRR